MSAKIVGRRQILMSGCAMAALSSFGLSVTQATAASGAVAEFDISARGQKVGSHSMQFRLSGDQLVVNSKVDVTAEFAGISLFNYKFIAQELWRGDVLQSLRSRTRMNGQTFNVSAVRQGNQVIIDGSRGRVAAPLGIKPTSYWKPALLRERRLLDMQRGIILDVQSAKTGTETINAMGGRVRANRYSMKGDANMELWYTPKGDWAAGAMKLKGVLVQFARKT